jgi:hypothetical protein
VFELNEIEFTDFLLITEQGWLAATERGVLWLAHSLAHAHLIW